MPPVLRKKNLREKDEIKGYGIYCITPFDNVDNHGKIVCKIGITTRNISQRIGDYHTSLPEGVWYIDFLKNSTLGKDEYTERVLEKDFTDDKAWWLKQKVWKQFGTHGIFSGKITRVNRIYAHVVYSDGDEEDLNKREIAPLVSSRKYLERIETFVFDKIKEYGGESVHQAIRRHNEGETEWIYASEKMIEKAFDDAKKIFGGKLEGFKMNDINRIASKKKNVIYTGNIIFDRDV